MPRLLRRPRAVSIALALAATACALPAVATAGPADQRTETPISSSSPQTDVLSSVVRLHVPMLPGAAPHPAACDWIAYERWRSADGPADPMQSDAVAVLFPGVLEGATAFDAVARNAIRESARRGRHIEVWGIDRRANCLEDHTGDEATERSGNVDDAIGYYYRGAAIDGKTFAGWGQSDRVLADIGMAQTMNDYNAVLTNELPSQPWRESHVICGGHSMGGPLTDIYASWDFDGNVNTTEDAGYRQCAGFIGFDTTLNAGSADTKNVPNKDLLGKLTAGLLGGATTGSIDALKAGLIPRHVDLLGINPQSMNALEIIAGFAEKDPNAEATPLVAKVPRTKSLEDFFHIAGSADLGSYLTSKDSIRSFRYTNMALLGQVMDDNAGAYGLVRTSFGYFDGAPLRRNKLPEQAQLIPGLGQLVSPGALMMPQKRPVQALSTWRNYDDLGTGTAREVGTGITTPAQESTDAVQFARAIHEGPLNLTENWFPIRLIVDEGLLAAGSRTGSLAGAMHGRAINKKPRIAVIAGDGIIGANGPKVDPRVLAPGYQHLDVLTSAEHQTGGQPEVSSQTLSNIIDVAVPQ